MDLINPCVTASRENQILPRRKHTLCQVAAVALTGCKPATGCKGTCEFDASALLLENGSLDPSFIGLDSFVNTTLELTSGAILVRTDNQPL